MNLTEDQKNAIAGVVEWYKGDKSKLLTMGGFAGTGKTTLISSIRDVLPTVNIAFVCYTGRASSVLRRKLKGSSFSKGRDYCGTIHRLIYEPVVDAKTKKITGWTRKEKIEHDWIVIDEASMVSEEIYHDLASYGVPIFAVGDHFQLPPLRGDFNLMKDPTLRLEKIHRQAEDNPIIRLSMIIRDEWKIPYGIFGDNVVKVYGDDPLVEKFLSHAGDYSDTMILCGFNKTRVELNEGIREEFGYGKEPVRGERVICLRNNPFAKRCPIFNGELGTVVNCTPHGKKGFRMQIGMDGESDNYYGYAYRRNFGNVTPDLSSRDVEVESYNTKQGKVKSFRKMDHFDFGYALTVHKAQGSQMPRVMVIEQPCDLWKGEIWARWLYTAVTRAMKELLVVKS